jgi:class 3 adenylate cyclase
VKVTQKLNRVISARTRSKRVGVLGWFYRKLGSNYPMAFFLVEIQSAFLVTAGTIVLFGAYYDEFQDDDYLPLLFIAIALTGIAVLINLVRTIPVMRPINRWIAGDRSSESTANAWRTAVGLPATIIKRDMWLPLFVVALPMAIAAILVVDLPALSFIPLFSGALVALGYSGIIHYLALERGMRPVLLDINSQVSPRTEKDLPTASLRLRLIAAAPLITIITGFVVAAITSEQSGVAPELDFSLAIAIATLMALELGILLSKTIIYPLDDLQRATEEVRAGNFDVSVPVTTGDEIGELAASFNEMVAGLAERERIREAFGTYLDREVAEYILSEGFAEEGVELEVSVLFCDVVNFTAFAAEADAAHVVSCLNELFEEIVPIVARHGGHVDKFVGDGLLAVFGAPEPHDDHADRATRAAIEMAKRVNEDGAAGTLRIGVGVNSGPVVAGSIGGAGRLNFSVIGDAVNVAARVESATRLTGDDVLLSDDTVRRHRTTFELIARGSHDLKGIAEPVQLHVPAERAGTLEARPRDARPVSPATPGADPVARR